MLALLAQVPGGANLEEAMLLWGLVDSHAEMWLWLALVLLIAEVFTVSFFAGAAAFAAVVAAGSAALGLGPLSQLVVFSVAGILSMIFVRPVYVRFLAPKSVATNADAVVGQPGTVVEQVTVGSLGRVRLANETWRARSDENLEVGEAVRVVPVQGNTLNVARE